MNNQEYAKTIKSAAEQYLGEIKKQYVQSMGYDNFEEVDEDMVRLWNSSISYLKRTFDELEDWARGRDSFEEEVLKEFKKIKERDQLMIGMLEDIRRMDK